MIGLGLGAVSVLLDNRATPVSDPAQHAWPLHVVAASVLAVIAVMARGERRGWAALVTPLTASAVGRVTLTARAAGAGMSGGDRPTAAGTARLALLGWHCSAGL